jgi:hypothetical protein
VKNCVISLMHLLMSYLGPTTQVRPRARTSFTLLRGGHTRPAHDTSRVQKWPAHHAPPSRISALLVDEAALAKRQEHFIRNKRKDLRRVHVAMLVMVAAPEVRHRDLI